MSARAWAASVQRDVTWSQLEVEAFAQYPDIREQLDPTHRFGRIRGGSTGRRRWRAVAMFVLAIGGFLAPIAGFAILLDGRAGRADIDRAFAVPVGGILFGVALVCLLADLVVTLVQGLRWSRLRAVYAGMVLAVGLISTPVAALRSADVPGGALYVALVASTTVVAFGVSILAIRAYRERDPVQPSRSHAAADGLAARLARIDALVERLTPAQQAAIRADIAAALADLRRRELMSPELFERAENAQLGHLVIALSAPRR